MEEKPPYKPSPQTFPQPQEFVQPRSSVQSPLTAILTPWSYQLVAYARQLNHQGHSSFAVVLAHAATEWAMEDALRRLLNHRRVDDDVAEPILSMFKVTSLTEDPVRKLFKSLTGATPSKETWWKDWTNSRELRNKIAHRGLTASSEQALQVLGLADSCCRYIAVTVENTLAK
jgi:hypothetical protein